jgi:hypothetical protein
LKAILVLSLFLLLLSPPSSPTASCEPGGEVALRFAYCHFNQAANASLGLNATSWFQYPFNDSYWWAWYGNLTWAFDPNLAFWAFVEADLPRISAAVAPDVPIEALGWNIPFSLANQASGFISNVGNPGYRYGGDKSNCLDGVSWAYPFPETSEGPFQPGTNLRAFNYTLVATTIPTLPMDQWTAEVWWNTTGVDYSTWNEVADRLAARLNATWYMENCHFPRVAVEGDCPDDTGSPWPFEMTFLGLLVLTGLLGSKRQHISRWKNRKNRGKRKGEYGK